MSDRPALAQLLLDAVRWFDVGVTQRMAQQGYPVDVVGRPHALLLQRLPPDGRSVADLARDTGVSRQFVHQLVRELGEVGLVEVVADPHSRRSKLVRLTATGVQARHSARQALDTLERQVADHLGRQSFEALMLALSEDWGSPERDDTQP